MKIAFCLFKYFPYGGLQRDFLQIAQESFARGHNVHVYVAKWEGDVPLGFHIHILSIKKVMSPYRRHLAFAEKLQDQLRVEKYDLIVGFNKFTGLDFYYAADPCYAQTIRSTRSFFYRLRKRYRVYAGLEKQIFSQKASTHALLISAVEQTHFQSYYGTPADRLHLLPPGIDQAKLLPYADRGFLRRKQGIPIEDHVVLMVGSGFRRKGVDRALLAIASLPEAIKQKTHLLIIGKDNLRIFNRTDSAIYKKIADRLGVLDRVRFLGGRDDVAEFLACSDLLLHPAYYENAGIVLLEAVASGLPVLTTDVCGYAHHILEANAGLVLKTPFLQKNLNQALLSLLTADKKPFRENALNYSAKIDLSSLHRKSVDIMETVFLQKQSFGLEIGSND